MSKLTIRWERGVVLLVAAFALFLNHTPVRAASAAQGWDQIWNNEFSQARETFMAALEEDEDDVEAWRGLVLADFAAGWDRHALDHLEELATRDGVGYEDFALGALYFRSVTTCGNDEKRVARIYERLSESESVSGLDARAMRSYVAVHAGNAGDLGTVRKVGGALHRVKTWSLLGMFDNLSGGGHERDYLEFPEKPLFGERRGKAGVRVSWFDPEVTSLDGEIDFSDYFDRATNATGYAGFDLTAEKETEVLVSISEKGALEVELDGNVALKIDDVQAQTEVNHLRVHLQRGRHVMVFKVSGRDDAPVVAVSVSAPDGGEAKDVRLAPLSASSGETTGATAELVPLPALERLKTAWEADRDDPRAAFRYLLALWLVDTRETARVVGDDVAQRFGDSAVMLFLAANSAGDVQDFDRYRARQRHAFDLAPEFAPALRFVAAEYRKQKAFARSDSLLAVATERVPEFVSAQTDLLLSYNERTMADKAVLLAEQMVEEHPDFSSAYEVLGDHAVAMGDRGRGKKMYKEAMKRHAKSTSLIARLVKAEEREDYGDVVDALERLHEMAPESPRIAAYLVRALIQKGDYEGAVSLARGTAEHFPYVAEAQHLNGAIEYLRAPYDPSRKMFAIEYFERALWLNPGDFETRDRVRELRGKPLVADMLPAVDLEKTRGDAVEPADYEGAGACVLLDDERRVCFEDGSSYYERVLVAQILAESGVERFGSLRLGVNTLFSDVTVKVAHTVKADGSLVDAEQVLDGVAFKNVEPGDFVELHYGVTGWSVGSLNREFWDEHRFKWDIPVRRSRYTLMVPMGTKFDWKIHNYFGDPDALMHEFTEEDYNRYEWTMENVPAVPKEPLAAPWRERDPWLDVSTIGSWDEVVSWYRDLSSPPSKDDPVVAETAKALTEGIGDLRAKVGALYRFVANDVAYEDLLFLYSGYVPEPARRVLEAKYGDCKDKVCLLKSMLESVGVSSYFVLVNTVDQGRQGYLPSPRFNHAVIAVDLEDAGDPADLWYLDPTARWLPSNQLPTGLWGAEALVVRDGTAGLTTLPAGVEVASVAPRSHIHTSISLGEGDDLVVKRYECIRDAEVIAAVRESYAGRSARERRDRLARSLNLGTIGVEVTRCDWLGVDETAADSLVQDYEFVMRRGANRQGNSLMMLKLPWDTALSRIYGAAASARERRTPMATYEYRLVEDETMTVSIPPGWRLLQVPDDVAYTSDLGHYRCEFEAAPDHLIVKRSLRIRPTLILPQEYPHFNEMVEGGVHQDEAVLVLERR